MSGSVRRTKAPTLTIDYSGAGSSAGRRPAAVPNSATMASKWAGSDRARRRSPPRRAPGAWRPGRERPGRRRRIPRCAAEVGDERIERDAGRQRRRARCTRRMAARSAADGRPTADARRSGRAAAPTDRPPRCGSSPRRRSRWQSCSMPSSSERSWFTTRCGAREPSWSLHAAVRRHRVELVEEDDAGRRAAGDVEDVADASPQTRRATVRTAPDPGWR